MNQDEQWLEVLAGREPQGVDEDLASEARALRSAILQRHANTESATVDLPALRRLQQRLQQENLLLTHRTHAPRWLAMAAALVLAVGLGLMLRQQTAIQETSSETLRGEQNQNTIRVADAKQAAAKLQQDLAALGITPRITQGPHSVRVEAYVPSERETEVNALLARYQIALNKDGHLLLTFDSAPRK